MKAHFHLPLLTYPDASSFALIQNAIDFARHQEAWLHVNAFLAKIPRVSPPSPSIVDVEKMRADAERSSRDCASLSETVRDYANKTDTAVTISSLETSPIASSAVQRVLFESGRPLLLLPADNCSGRIGTVAIAWDGSATLARALTGARLFLDKASKAVLISVTDDKEIDADLRGRFAATLRDAGLEVEIVTTESHGNSAAGTIQVIAAEVKQTC